MRHILNTISISLATLLLTSSLSFAQNVIVDIDFDDTKPAHMSAYGFAGYGDQDGGNKELGSDKMKAAVVEKDKAGKKNAAGEDSNGAVASLDATAFEVPADSVYDYGGWGISIAHDLTDHPLPTTDVSKYTVKFDAKIEGAKSLSNSKFRMEFVVPDGKGAEADDDDHDDVVLRLGKGADSGLDCLTLTSEFQTFTVELADTTVKNGSKDDLKNHEITGLVFTVQAQGNSTEIGKDSDNMLFIDNVQLIEKK